MKIDHKTLFDSVANNLQDGMYIVNTERKILFWNKAAENITGYSADEIVNKHCQDNLLNHISKDGIPLCRVACPLLDSIMTSEQRQAEVYLRHKNGHRIPIITNIFPIVENGVVQGAVEIFTISSPKVYEDGLISSLTEAATKDILTKLPNRRYASEFIEYRLSALKRLNLNFCVIFGDIDEFSYFNDTYGHDLGDAVLISVANSIRYSLRSTDLWARWGGEEFIGIFSVGDESGAQSIAEKLRILISETQIKRGDQNLSVTISLGVTMARKTDSLSCVVGRADELMYRSKRSGRNRVTVG